MEELFDNDYIKMMQALLKDEYAAYLDSFKRGPVNALRVNTLKIEPSAFIKKLTLHLTPVPWTKDAFYYAGDKENLSKDPYFAAGLYYLQEASAMLPAEALNVQEGDIVLDMCAAPGGKSTKLLASLKNQGLLIANDISASRANALVKNLELFGAVNAYVISEDLTKHKKRFKHFFSKILIDAPCSGEGMFHKDPGVLKNYRQKSKAYYTDIQKALLDTAYELLMPGGEVVYSTCTFDPLENEGAILSLLQKHPDMHIIPIDINYEGFAPGIEYGGYDFHHALRLYPHHLKGEGHFCCKIKKDGKLIIPHKQNFNIPKINLPKPFNELELLNNGKLISINDDLYRLPDHYFDFNKLRTLRSGLKVGSFKNARFKPDTALALALNPQNFKAKISFKHDDIRINKYLKGETIDLCGLDYHEGYNLICLEDYPLGFAHIKNGIFKNSLGRGWIRP